MLRGPIDWLLNAAWLLQFLTVASCVMLSAATTSAAEQSLLHGPSLIPLSQLVRFERCRGFATANSPQGRSNACRVQGPGRPSCQNLSPIALRQPYVSGHRGDAAATPTPSQSRRDFHHSSPSRSLVSSVKSFFSESRGTEAASSSGELQDHELDELVEDAFDVSKAQELNLDTILIHMMSVDMRCQAKDESWQKSVINRLKGSSKFQRVIVTSSSGKREVIFKLRKARMKSPGRSSSRGNTTSTAVSTPGQETEQAVTTGSTSTLRPLRAAPTPIFPRGPSKPGLRGAEPPPVSPTPLPSQGYEDSSLIESLTRRVLVHDAALQRLADSVHPEALTARRLLLRRKYALRIGRKLAIFRAKLRVHVQQMEVLESQNLGILASRYRSRNDISSLVTLYLRSEAFISIWEAVLKVETSIKDLERQLRQVPEARAQFTRYLKQSAVQYQEWIDHFKHDEDSFTRLWNGVVKSMWLGISDMVAIAQSNCVADGLQINPAAESAHNWQRIQLTCKVLRLNIGAIGDDCHQLRFLVFSDTQAHLSPSIFGHQRRLVRLQYELDRIQTLFHLDIQHLKLYDDSTPGSRLFKCKSDLVRWQQSYRHVVGEAMTQAKLFRLQGLRFVRSPLGHYLASVFRSFYVFNVTAADMNRETSRVILDMTSPQSSASSPRHQVYDIDPDDIQPTSLADEDDGFEDGGEANGFVPTEAYGTREGFNMYMEWSKARSRHFFQALDSAVLALGTSQLYRLCHRGYLSSPRVSKRLLKVEGNMLGYEPTVTPAPGIPGTLSWPKLDSFYPPQRAIPVEYAFTRDGIHNALQDFSESRVLGLDIQTGSAWRFARSVPLLTSVMLASADKVVILSLLCVGRNAKYYGTDVGRLLDLLCNPSIRKVGFKMDRTREFLNRRFFIQAQGLLDLPLGNAQSESGHVVRDPNHVASAAFTTTPRGIYIPGIPRSQGQTPNTMAVVRNLAARPYAALKVYHDRHGFEAASMSNERGEASDKPPIDSIPTFGPLRLDPAPKLTANSIYGFSGARSTAAGHVSREQCILDLARDMTVDLYASLLRRSDKNAAYRLVAGNTKARVCFEQFAKLPNRPRFSILAAKVVSLNALEDLKAYCLATALNEDINYVGRCLRLISPARSVLEVAEIASLPLHDYHRVALEAAKVQEPPLASPQRYRERRTEEDAKRARVVPLETQSQVRSTKRLTDDSGRSSTRVRRRRPKIAADRIVGESKGRSRIPATSSASNRAGRAGRQPTPVSDMTTKHGCIEVEEPSLFETIQGFSRHSSAARDAESPTTVESTQRSKRALARGVRSPPTHSRPRGGRSRGSRSTHGGEPLASGPYDIPNVKESTSSESGPYDLPDDTKQNKSAGSGPYDIPF